MSKEIAAQVFRLQLVDAEDNVVARFACGGRVEIDLVAAIAAEIRKTWTPPVQSFVGVFLSRLRCWCGLTTRKAAHRELMVLLTEWEETGGGLKGDAIEVATAAVIMRLKHQGVAVLNDALRIS